ncbi:MAG TPA: hypothetical protein DCW74_19015 [Alteromonas australica]|uniref:Uncharacterized protein n=1 Tax=Alteromonas australica TaxID=589873 RepID=A0A350P945_9ALTE|nr:hypothetical protein [Alteromonas australica]
MKKTWSHRIRELFNKKMQATTAFKERQKITDAAKRLSPWPDSDSENFIDALLNSRELPTNKYRQSLLFLCNTRQNFYLLHDDGGMKEILSAKKMKQIKEKSLDSWDMPFLKNMLLYYCIGPSPETVRPLLKLPNMSDAQWEAQKKIIRDVNDYRNKLLHQQGIEFTEDDLASLKKTFKEFVKKYFGPQADKALLDKLEKKESELEKARFLF